MSAARAGLRPARLAPGSSKVAEPHLLESRRDYSGRTISTCGMPASSNTGPRATNPARL
jgi:hypothetical protein